MIRNFLRKSIDQSSPQATIEGFKSALTNEKWRQALRYLRPKAQADMAGALLMTAGYASDGDDIATPRLIKIMKRHGLRKHEKFDIETANFGAIVKDLFKWSDKYLPDDKKLNLADTAAQAEYSEYRIKDDTAYVIATCKGRRSESRLKRVNGLWYLQ